MDFTSGNLISQTYPSMYDVGIPITADVQIHFLRDMDSSTFDDTTVFLEVVGTIARVPATLTYSDKVLTISPTQPLQPATTYEVSIVGDNTPAQDVFTQNITGIRDITGNGMIGIFKLIFTTSTDIVLTAPTLTNPIAQSALLTQPNFEWTGVANATGYQVQLATTDAFEDIVWPSNPWTWSTPSSSVLSVIPSITLTTNQEYWWRVRACGSTTFGPWSIPFNFFYGDPTQGSVTPSDAPFGLLPPGSGVIKVIATFPFAGSNNIQNDHYPDHVSVTLNGNIDPGGVTNDTFWIEGIPVDSIFSSASFKPIFSPSLNGAIYQSGGLTAPAPVDAYQQILASGRLQNTDQPEVISDINGNTVISLHLPGGYMQDNNAFDVHLSIPELQNPVKFSFTSEWFPAFSTPQSIRYQLDHFLPNVSDEEIWFHIRRNSLEALFLQIYPPTQVDGNTWLYNPPVSFDVNNPPYFVREYVRLQTTKEFMNVLLLQILTRGKVQLGDLTIDPELYGLKPTLQYAVEQIDEEIRPYLDKLHGHTNRGWARGDWSQRSERIKNWAGFTGFPFRKGF